MTPLAEDYPGTKLASLLRDVGTGKLADMGAPIPRFGFPSSFVKARNGSITTSPKSIGLPTIDVKKEESRVNKVNVDVRFSKEKEPFWDTLLTKRRWPRMVQRVDIFNDESEMQNPDRINRQQVELLNNTIENKQRPDLWRNYLEDWRSMGIMALAAFAVWGILIPGVINLFRWLGKLHRRGRVSETVAPGPLTEPERLARDEAIAFINSDKLDAFGFDSGRVKAAKEKLTAWLTDETAYASGKAWNFLLRILFDRWFYYYDKEWSQGVMHESAAWIGDPLQLGSGPAAESLLVVLDPGRCRKFHHRDAVLP